MEGRREEGGREEGRRERGREEGRECEREERMAYRIRGEEGMNINLRAIIKINICNQYLSIIIAILTVHDYLIVTNNAHMPSYYC